MGEQVNKFFATNFDSDSDDVYSSSNKDSDNDDEM